MKRLFLSFILILILFSTSYAGVTQKEYSLGNGLYCIKFDIVAASDGSVTATWTTNSINGYIVGFQTDPGTTAPTDNYDITLLDLRGHDAAGTALLNRDTSTTETAYPIDETSGNNVFPAVMGPIQVNVANNIVNGAMVSLLIYVQR